MTGIAKCNITVTVHRSFCGPCSVVGPVPPLPWVRSRVWVRVRLGSGLATGKGWLGTWPVATLDPFLSMLCLQVCP